MRPIRELARRVPSSTLHRVLTVAWALLAVPTVLWWSESVLWIGLISIYANAVSHWGAAEAASAKETAEQATE